MAKLRNSIFVERSGLVIESPRDLAACRIAMRVKDAIPAVRAFQRKQKFRSFTIELNAPLDQFLNRARTFLNQNANGLPIAQAGAGDHRVLLVEFDFVVVAESGRDPALRVFGRGFSKTIFGDHQD